MEPEQSNHDDGVSLPEDIVFDVLGWLPAKALCRFRCVSKAWHAFISDPAFRAMQKSYAGPHLVGVVSGASTSPPEVRVMDMDGNIVRVFEVRQLSKEDTTEVLAVLQQANTRLSNIICVDYASTGAKDVIIIDPAAGYACTVGMNTTWNMSSFGRAAQSGTLKVLYIQSVYLAQICKVATIVQDGAEPITWRQRSTLPAFIPIGNTERATVNGIIYFMARLSEHDAESNLGYSNHITAFNLESEEWNMTDGPPFGNQDGTVYVTLTELKGTLGVVQCLCYDDHYYAIIWLLTDFSNGVWVKEHTIEMPKRWGLNKILGALDDGRLLLLVSERDKVNMLVHQNVLVFFNPSTKMFTTFREIRVGFNDKLVLYNGSLLS